jgi:hypothetical protein
VEVDDMPMQFYPDKEYGEVMCDSCKEWATFYATSEEEFLEEVLAFGWTINNGEYKCGNCQHAEGVVMYLRSQRKG